MRILYIDIDTLRADHLGCYGYLRNTSPNIDRIAAEGVRFENCYVSDAPCLPARTSMFVGRFGIHTGVVNHGGLGADMRPIGRERSFRTDFTHPGFVMTMRHQGIYPVSFSPFAERHSAWWFCEGWREMHNPGKSGSELAHEVVPAAIDWVKRNAKKDNWFLHVHTWDPHTPYRTPQEFGNSFEDKPLEGWYTEEIRRQQWNSFGPGSPQEPGGGYGQPRRHPLPRQPDQIASMDDYKKWIDGYDVGIAYGDEWIGRLLDALAGEGVLDETAIIITSDHGENLGELGVIGDHAVADHITSRVPMIIRWPGLPGARVDDGLYIQNDFAATILKLLGAGVPHHWDGRSFAEAFKAGQPDGHEYVVISQCAWSCMRGVRWADNLFLRVFHTGLKNLPERMLFNVARDPHELDNLAESQPALADHGDALLAEWTADMMRTSDYDVDPLWTVMREGGPFHTRGALEKYAKRLRETGRGHHADFLEAHPDGLRR
ncbi:MAG: sulfatase [Planctomycetota bacterium]|jgi:arylsulfatase A-like enzyme